ncbi:hypothetical protein Memar_2397 [Methanoculleus marisnigri JR1]|uniref:Uncharacterized protein n=1 Tax=Methanoculleus marisnigri (strain ATCC 35101 / DSM 1498 / JR1) TaxID=368407 RepID=A3CY70_METMJ|nr:hypothetical protein Memar_2397 [Methanoculleus marisnigri JR1]
MRIGNAFFNSRVLEKVRLRTTGEPTDPGMQGASRYDLPLAGDDGHAAGSGAPRTGDIPKIVGYWSHLRLAPIRWRAYSSNPANPYSAPTGGSGGSAGLPVPANLPPGHEPDRPHRRSAAKNRC